MRREKLGVANCDFRVVSNGGPADTLPDDMKALGPDSTLYLNALERAVVLSLTTLADLARAACEVDRCARLSAALAQLGYSATPASRAALSKRQYEVAELVARGLTNGEIAGVLVISERTADTHIQNILGRLRLVSRAQLAAWYVEHCAVLTFGKHQVSGRQSLAAQRV